MASLDVCIQTTNYFFEYILHLIDFVQLYLHACFFFSIRYLLKIKTNRHHLLSFSNHFHASNFSGEYQLLDLVNNCCVSKINECACY